MRLRTSDCSFTQRVLNIDRSGVYLQHCLVGTRLAPRETAAVSARSVYTTQPCIMSRHCMKSHVRKGRVHLCFVVTGHLHFWQNDRDILRSTAVTRGGANDAQIRGFDKRVYNYL